MMKQLLILFTLTLIISSCSRQSTTALDPRSTQLTEDQIFNATAQPKDFPLILRRTTLIVRNIDESLKLYKDQIGMEVIYDHILTRPRKNESGEQKVRLVFLKASHEFVGVLGLLEYNHGEDIQKKEVTHEGFTEQNIVLLFNTKDMKRKFKMIAETPSIEVVTEPKIVEYPGYDGSSTIRVLVSTFYDPDGFLVEFNQLMDDL